MTPRTSARLPGGSQRSLCTTCCEVFSTTANFDRHRRKGLCVDPESVGLVIKPCAGGTVWKMPGDNVLEFIDG
jgi:hypothetical protein